MEEMEQMDVQYDRDPSEENHRSANETKHEHVSLREEKLEHDETLNMIDMMDINESDQGSQGRGEKREKHEPDGFDRRTTFDLNKCLFNTIVQLCYREKLISEEVAHSFFTNYTVGQGKRYIELFRSNKLGEFDFAKCKINIIDHRRLTEMLVRHRPERYLPLTPPENPFDFVKEIHEFLKEIYAQNLSSYEILIESQTSMYYQAWWGGPLRMDPSIDPPVKFYQTQESKKTREAKQAAILIRSMEQERQRDKRINTHRVTEADLKQIATRIPQSSPQPPKDIKYEGEAVSNDNEDSSSKGGKRKRIKKDKERKEKEKPKKSKKKKEKKRKLEEDEQYQPKREAETSKPESRRSRKAKKEAAE